MRRRVCLTSATLGVAWAPLLLTFVVLVFVVLIGVVSRPVGAQTTAAQQRQEGSECLRARNYKCAEKAYTGYIAQRPTDPVGYALRGIMFSTMERYQDSIRDLERAIELGEGTYDIFAHYAEGLRHTGRTREAIDWSYKTLTVVSTLVDVRDSLATMLVSEGRHHEALTLLAGFDAELARKGHAAYFGAKRLAIEVAIERRGAPATGAHISLRLPKVDSFFYAPVAIGGSRPAAFIVDTGAVTMVLSREQFAESKAPHKVLRAGVRMKAADNRHVAGDMVSLAHVTVGPFVLKDVQTFVCAGCLALLGQDMLSNFDVQSARVQGVEFMTLTARTPLVR